MRKLLAAAPTLLFMGAVLLGAESTPRDANRAAAEFRSRGGQATFRHLQRSDALFTK
jgi:hypothetical protein